MGFFGFVMAGGGSIGVLLGGVLTDAAQLALDLPRQHPGRDRGLRALACRCCRPTASASGRAADRRRRSGDRHRRADPRRLRDRQRQRERLALGRDARPARRLAVVLLRRLRHDRVARRGPARAARLFRKPQPLGRERRRRPLVGRRCSRGSSSSAHYLRLVLGYDPLHVGLAFLPANVIMGAFSLGLSARIVMRFGTRLPIGVGMALVSLGLLLFARAPVNGSFWRRRAAERWSSSASASGWR